MELQKFLFKRIAIIIVVAIFSIAGIIACSGDAITGSGGRRGYSYTQDDTDQTNEGPSYTNGSGNTNETQKPDPEPTPTYSENSYVWVYAPFSGKDYQYVSFEDTNTLTQIWEDMINRKEMNDGTRWIIRGGGNRFSGGSCITRGNYFYFNKNLDIVHGGRYANKVMMKKFLGPVIARYWGGNLEGTWCVAGLYETMLNKYKDAQNGGKGYCDYNDDNLNEFMGYKDNLQRGDLEIIVLNTGLGFGVEYGVNSYYCTSDNDYRKNKDNFLGKDPEVYYKKLNCKVNHSRDLEKFNFKFAYGPPLYWHLQ